MTCGYCEKPIVLKLNATKNYKRRFCDAAHYHVFLKEKKPLIESERYEEDNLEIRAANLAVDHLVAIIRNRIKEV